MGTSATAVSATSPVVETSAAVISAAETSAEAATSRRSGQLLAAGHLSLHDLAHELDHAGIAAHPQVTPFVSGSPVLQVALRNQLVELRAADRDVDARVGRRLLGDLRAGELHSPDRHVSPMCAQLEPDDELQVLERRHFGRELCDCLV